MKTPEERRLKTISVVDFEKLPADYRGVWTNTTRPGWIGKRTMLSYDIRLGTVLLIEGVSFQVLEAMP